MFYVYIRFLKSLWIYIERNFHDLYSPLLFPLKFSLIYADSETNDSEIVILSLERRLENLEKLYFPL